MTYLQAVNFIAHIHLSGQKPGTLVGNYIADLIHHKDLNQLPKDIQEGVMLHRFIDSYTDQHLINKNTLDLLYPRHRKYAPVLLDIYYDYFLIRHWNNFSNQDLLSVCENTYRVLTNHLDEIPSSAKRNIENLLNKRWLMHAYSDIAGMERTFYYLKMRLSRPEWVEGASQTLIDLDSELDDAFLTFYPQLVVAAEEFANR